MKVLLMVTVLAVLFSACDESRVYEQNYDFNDRYWLVNEQPVFEFEIKDTVSQYNLYCNLRNSVSFPFSRLFINYSLQDSTGNPLNKKLTEAFLFDPQTGKPQGSSGLGDIYDQQISLNSQYRFPYAGKYKVQFGQSMRVDSLEGVLAVGLRVEKVVKE
jgi:gliding motility-associated lipoprotein GldH